MAEIKKTELTVEQGVELAQWRKSRRWSPNRLRHAAATLVRREMGIDAARVILGHTDADTTVIYAERDRELARVAMERFKVRAGDQKQKARKRKAASNTRYTCPAREPNAWAKPGANLVCGDCGESMDAEQ